MPLPLPPGGELAAIWSANLGQPIGSVKKFDDTLARSYTQITNQEISVSFESIKVKLTISIKHDLSGNQLLSLLDLPNLKTSEVGGDKTKRHRRRRRRVEVKPITIEVDRVDKKEDEENDKVQIKSDQPTPRPTRVLEFEPFKKV